MKNSTEVANRISYLAQLQESEHISGVVRQQLDSQIEALTWSAEKSVQELNDRIWEIYLATRIMSMSEREQETRLYYVAELRWILDEMESDAAGSLLEIRPRPAFSASFAIINGDAMLCFVCRGLTTNTDNVRNRICSRCRTQHEEPREIPNMAISMGPLSRQHVPDATSELYP